MSDKITPQKVYDALEPVIGPVAGHESVCGKAADLLLTLRPGRMSVKEMNDRMQRLLFNSLFNLLGDDMQYRTQDGKVRKILLAELPGAADAALEPMLDSLPITPTNYRFLTDSAMSGGSVSAMRVLCRRYRGELSEANLRLMLRIIAENGRPE